MIVPKTTFGPKFQYVGPKTDIVASVDALPPKPIVVPKLD